MLDETDRPVRDVDAPTHPRAGLRCHPNHLEGRGTLWRQNYMRIPAQGSCQPWNLEELPERQEV